jgi:hypothetical protein
MNVHLLFMNHVAFQTCHFTLDVYNFQACLPDSNSSP